MGITMVYLMAILSSMNFELEEEELEAHLKTIDSNCNPQEINFEQFARLVAILLEELNKEVSQEEIDYIQAQEQQKMGEMESEEGDWSEDQRMAQMEQMQRMQMEGGYEGQL